MYLMALTPGPVQHASDAVRDENWSQRRAGLRSNEIEVVFIQMICVIVTTLLK
jgi:hypothetical protein